MAEPLLVARHQSGAARVFTLEDSMSVRTLTQIGDDLPSSAIESDIRNAGSDTEAAHSNKVINAFGGVYGAFADGVYKLQTGSNFGEWSKDSADGGVTFSGSTPRISYSVEYGVTNNTPYIFGLYNRLDDTTFRGWRLNLLTGVSEETSDIGFSNLSMVCKGSTFYNNCIWLQATNGGNFTNITQISLSPLKVFRHSFSDVGSGSVSDNGTCWDVFQGDLYRLVLDDEAASADREWQLQRLDAGDWEPLASFPSGNNNKHVKACLFNDGSSLYAITYDRDLFPNGGWEMTQLNVSNRQVSVGADLTNIVLPSDLRAGGALVIDRRGRWWPFVEQTTDGSTQVVLYFAEEGTTGATVNRYEFVDENTELNLAAGGAIQGGGTLAFPEGNLGGGSRILRLNESTMTVYARERTSNGEKITFRVHPPINPDMASVTTGLIAKFYIGSNGTAPTTQANLLGNATGGSATRNLNQVENITADDTDYTVTIDTSNFSDNTIIELGAELTSS